MPICWRSTFYRITIFTMIRSIFISLVAFSMRTIIMNPNSFRFRLITLDEVSMPVGNGQIVGLQRFRFDGNALNGLLSTVFSKMKKRPSEKLITVSDDLLLLSFQPNLCLPLMLFIVVRFCRIIVFAPGNDSNNFPFCFPCLYSYFIKIIDICRIRFIR